MALRPSNWERDGLGNPLMWAWDAMVERFVGVPRGALLVFCVEAYSGLGASAALASCSFQWSARWIFAQRQVFLREFGYPPLFQIPYGYPDHADPQCQHD